MKLQIKRLTPSRHEAAQQLAERQRYANSPEAKAKALAAGKRIYPQATPKP